MASTDRKSPLPIGVIGVGHLGTHHARVCHQAPGWDLCGVFDIDPERNRDTAARYRLTPCEHVDDLLSRVAAVSICTPTESHFEIARRAVVRGCHVFVEKPVCGTEDEAETLAALAREHGVTGMVGQIERFNPALAAVRERLGLPRFIEAHRLNRFSPRGLSTDVILELMIHDIDLVRWLVGEEPVEIRAAGVAVLSGTDDIANCRLAFPGGCVANLTASRISANPMRKIRVFSREHYTSIDLAAKSVESYRLFDESSEQPDPGYITIAQTDGRRLTRWSAPTVMFDSLEAEFADFHDAITRRRSPRVDLAEGGRSLRVALDVLRACREQAGAAAHEDAVENMMPSGSSRAETV